MDFHAAFCGLVLTLASADALPNSKNVLANNQIGAEIVQEVIEQLQTHNLIRKADGLFLRRVAFVESRVDKLKYEMTTKCAHGNMFNLCVKVQQTFGISWQTTSWDDLVKPLYSGIGASLYIASLNGFHTSRSLAQQADIWAKHYHDGGVASNFISLIGGFIEESDSDMSTIKEVVPIREHELMHVFLPENSVSTKLLNVTIGTGRGIIVNVNCGFVNIFGSYKTSTPNVANHQMHLTATDGTPAVINIDAANQTLHGGDILFLTILANKLNGSLSDLQECRNASYTLSVAHGSKVVCQDDVGDRECTKTDLILDMKLSHDLCNLYKPLVPNPCTLDYNIRHGKLYHPYPDDNTKFIQCDGQRNMFVNTCPNGKEYFTRDACGSPCQQQQKLFPVSSPYNYQRCFANGSIVLERCPSYTVFSYSSQRCYVNFPALG